MAKNYFHGEITSAETDWAVGDASTNNLPCSGESVQRYIKERLASLQSGLATKPSYGEFTGTMLNFYAQEGDTTPLFNISLSSTLYVITITNDLGNSFYVLTSETERLMTISATTQEGRIGSETYTDVNEDYNYIVAIDSGNGYVQRYEGELAHGGTATFDIRPFISTGSNRVRVTVTGQTSNTTKTNVYTAIVTSLSLTVTHTWNTPWIQGSDYVINNIRFAGNVPKTVHIAVDGTEVVTESYSSNTSYTTTATTLTIDSSDFPLTTGIHAIHIWLSSDDVVLSGYTYNIMCIETSDVGSVALVCINNVAEAAVNFTTSPVFSYATYNTTSVLVNITLTDANAGKTTSIITDQLLTVANAETQYTYTLSLDYDSEASSGLSLNVSAEATDNTEETTIPVDNSHAYIATPDAWFYMRPGLRDNSEENRENFVNIVNGDEYEATWTGFTFTRDAWYRDLRGFYSLVVPAGTHVSVPIYLIPNLEDSVWTGYTLEMMLQSGYPSDYDSPILSISNGTEGLKVYPTSIEITNSANQSKTVQYKENTITHLTVVWQRNYAGKNDGAHHLCTVYINGVNNITFAYDGGATWGHGELEIGQNFTDTYLYMARAYNKALEGDQVKNNYLNAMIDGAEFIRSEVAAKNDIVDGTAVSYDLVKRAGFNTMVVEMTSGNLPSVLNQGAGMSNLRFEYAKHPEWNVYITDAPIDGQGTTSMMYYRWNLRWKLAKADASKGTPASIWHYSEASGLADTTRTGWFDGENNHPKVQKIVAKTNYASSMQGHKMGACGLYNDLAAQLGLFSENTIPSSARAAIYQHPFFGFQYNSNDGSYTFIGLFTVGPDKGDKGTFDFDTDAYSSLLSLEGPNHAPLGTRFLTPWLSSNVTYSASGEKAVKEKILFNGEQGWEVSVAGDYGTDETSDESAILALATSEWKPSYDFVFYNSPYVVPLGSTGYASIGALNSDIENFRKGTSTIVLNGRTVTISNQLVQVYDSSYNLYGFANGIYVSCSHNIKTYLSLTGSPTQAEIIAARGANFAANVESDGHFSKDWLVYHWCYCVRYGVSDNFAKNSYPVKYKLTDNGGLWAWREDDMDTLFKTDNNGNQTKPYDIEHGDTVAGVEIFQGGNSALWVLVREFLQTEIQSMMSRMTAAISAMAASLGIAIGNTWQHEFNLIDYYFWKQSAQYFGINGYNFDREFKYIVPWVEDAAATYNNVAPLTQALGDQYECEREWVTKRLAYIYAKYRLTGMSGDTRGFGNAEFTLAQSFTFNLTPAINYYPVVSLASANYPATATKIMAGETVSVTVPTGGDTTNYLHGMNYLRDLGDLSGMLLGNRGGDASVGITFSVSSDRLQTLTVGKESGTVTFNAVEITLSNCYSLLTVDARNVVSLNRNIDLRTCPRIREVYLSGTSIPSLNLAKGSRIETLTLPATLQSLYLNTLPRLSTLTTEGTTNIQRFYLADCPNVNVTDLFWDLLGNIMAARENGSTLVYYITALGLDITATVQQMDVLASFFASLEETPALYGYVGYTEEGDVYNLFSGLPSLSGRLDWGYIQNQDMFARFNLNVSLYYIKFKDPVMHKICMERYQSDDTNITVTSSLADSDAQEETLIAQGKLYSRYDEYDENDSWVSTTFLGAFLAESALTPTGRFATLQDTTYQTLVTSFDELQYFTNITSLGSTASEATFRGCTNLKSVKLPPSLTVMGYSFMGCSSLEAIEIPDSLGSIGQGAFQSCTSLKSVKFGTGLTFVTMYAFYQCTSLERVDVPSIEDWVKISWGGEANGSNPLQYAKHLYVGGEELTEFICPSTKNGINQASFVNCLGLTNVVLHDNVTEINVGAFSGCSNIHSISLGTGLTHIRDRAFVSCTSIRHIYISDIGAWSRISYGGNSSVFGNTATSKHLYLNGEEIFDLVIPEGMTSCYSYLLQHYESLTSVKFPDSLQTTGSYSLRYLTACEKIVLGTGITSINNQYSIGRDCPSLNYFIIKAVTPPSCGSTSISYVRSDCTIYVPEASLSAYQGASNWAAKKNQMVGATFEEENGTIYVKVNGNKVNIGDGEYLTA